MNPGPRCLFDLLALPRHVPDRLRWITLPRGDAFDPGRVVSAREFTPGCPRRPGELRRDDHADLRLDDGRWLSIRPAGEGECAVYVQGEDDDRRRGRAEDPRDEAVIGALYDLAVAAEKAARKGAREFVAAAQLVEGFRDRDFLPVVVVGGLLHVRSLLPPFGAVKMAVVRVNKTIRRSNLNWPYWFRWSMGTVGFFKDPIRSGQ